MKASLRLSFVIAGTMSFGFLLAKLHSPVIAVLLFPTAMIPVWKLTADWLLPEPDEEWKERMVTVTVIRPSAIGNKEPKPKLLTYTGGDIIDAEIVG